MYGTADFYRVRKVYLDPVDLYGKKDNPLNYGESVNQCCFLVHLLYQSKLLAPGKHKDKTLKFVKICQFSCCLTFTVQNNV